MSNRKIDEYVSLYKEYMEFMRKRKSVWMAPIFFMFILIGALFIVLEGSVVAPLIYTIF